MNKLNATLTVLILATSTTCGWAANPCMPIAQACMKEGYYKGGEKTGKGLINDCVQPVVSKQKTLANVSFSDADLQACKTTLAEKMKENQAGQAGQTAPTGH